MKLYFLEEEKNLINNKYKNCNFISKNNLHTLKADILYVFNKENINSFITLVNNHNLYETLDINYIVLEDLNLLDIIYNNINNVLDVKFDEDAFTKNIYRFFRINDKKFYAIVRNFKNFYYVEDKNGEYETIYKTKARKEYNYFLSAPVDKVFEKDIVISKRYTIEKAKKNKINLNGRYRTIYFDIETNASVDSINTPNEIISIVSQDSFTNEVKSWVIDSRKEEPLIEQERKMIKEFLEYTSNFDVIAGWNIIKFDIPYLLNRASRLGIDKNLISLANLEVNCKHNEKSNMYPWFIKIAGLNIVDMMQSSVRALAYLDEKLVDNKLDTVAEKILGETKIHTDTPAVLFRENRIKELLDYNIQDVLLLQKIDTKLGIIDLLVNSIEFVPGLNLEDTNYNSKIIDYYLLYKFNIVLPTVDRNKIKDIEGAIVFEPVDGIHDNVAVMDIAGMYPNLIVTFNISPDCIVEDKEDTINIKIKNGTVKYSASDEGILVKLVKDFKHLREKYKKLKKEHENDKDYELYKLREFATKKILSSVYGVFGFNGFRLFNNKIANSITSVGRELLLYMKHFAEENNLVCVAGDTDSIFVKSKNKEYDYDDFCNRLNSSLDKFVSKFTNNENIIKNHTLLIEYETLFDRIIMPQAKKKYIGLASMIKGKILDKYNLYYKGSELNKKDVPKKFKDIIRSIVMYALTTNDEYDVLINVIKKMINNINLEDVDIKDLLIYKEINRDFDKYKVLPQHVRAAINSNKYLNTNFSRENYKGGILYVENRNDVDVLFVDPNNIDIKNFKIDFDKYKEKFIYNKIQLIFGEEIYNKIMNKDTLLSNWF